MPSCFAISTNPNPLDWPEKFVTDERYRLDFPCLGKKSVNFFFGLFGRADYRHTILFPFFPFLFQKTPPIHLIWWFAANYKDRNLYTDYIIPEG